MKNLVAVGGLIVCLVVALLLSNQSASAAPQTGVPQNRTPVSEAVGEQIARAYLSDNAARLELTQADLTDLKIDINFADQDSGNRYVKFMQQVNGIEIYNAMVNVTILADGSVLYVGNRGIGDALARSNSATPVLSHTDAIAAAADALGLSYDPSTVTAEQSFGTVDQKMQFAGGNLSLESMTVRLMYQPVADGSLRLVWQVDIYQQDGLDWVDVRVDAATGAVLDRSSRVVSENWDAFYSDPYQVPTGAVPGEMNAVTATTFASEIVAPYAPAAMVGSYRVYQMPVESPNHSSPPTPADGRTLVANPDNATASPFGWHDTNGASGAEFTTTQGNNTHAYTDIDANNLPDAGSSPDGGAGLVFDFPLDLTQAPSAYRPAAVTNLFYWTNILHDVSYVHGFNEAARNFQENNYGNGGLGSDYINAEGQDGSEFNNARYFHAAEGSNPRFQMYLWSAPNPDRDGDLDNGIILHEYGHGISLRLTGNGNSCLNNAEQMGEGWSDFQSIMLTQRPGDTSTTPRGVGTYALNQPPDGPGIRPARYTTDMTVNPYTYSNLGSLAVPHGVGFLWNTMLWDLNWKLIEEHGFNANIYGDYTTGGNNLTYRLVHDAMKIQPCSPGFVDGRDTILAADTALTGGDNTCLIWEAFARRGVGFSASQGSAGSTSDGTAAFDLPPECTGGPTPTPTTAPQAPDINVTPAAVTETHSNAPETTNEVINIQNTGTGSLNWTIAEDDNRPWNSPNPVQPRDANAPVERLGAAGGATTIAPEAGPIVGDGSFEAGTPNPEWEEFSANFGTPLCDAVCGTGGGTGPRTGLWWAWFGGTTAAETGILTQTVTIPSGSAELSFWLEIPATATGTNGFLSVRMDGMEVFRAEETTTGYGTYAEVTVDASAYADGGAHELVFFSSTDAGAAVTNFFVDDVAITATTGGACSAPTDIPWLTVSPTNGTTTGGGSTPVTLTFNSATLAQGTYTGTLCVESNDADEELVTVPVTLNVGPPTAIDLNTFSSDSTERPFLLWGAVGLLFAVGVTWLARRK